MEELNQFEILVLHALSKVDNSYYSTTYQNIENFKMAFRHRSGNVVDHNFERYGERVFCYEFYHQLRILIDVEKMENPEFLKYAVLQAEVQKMQILQLNERLKLHPMSGEFAPDFLMHSPGNAESHPFVIEVKSEHDVTPKKVMADLLKLNEFVIRYNYQRALFVSVNAPIDHITQVLGILENDISGLEGRKNIKVICKQTQHSNHQIWQL